MTSKFLTRDQILQAADIRSESVAVPEWGGEVLVYALTGAERDEFEGGAVDMSSGKAVMDFTNLRARLCVASIRNEEGEHLFNTEDIEALGAKSAAALQRVFEVAQRLSKLTASDVESLTKNS